MDTPKTTRRGDYDYWQSPSGTRYWYPTKEYLERVAKEHPFKTSEEMVLLRWVGTMKKR